MTVTKIEDMIVPEVMADMISAKVEKKVIISKIAKVDTTLSGQPGNEVTVPQYKYIGDAEDIAEGVAMGTAKLETGSTSFTIKKAGKGVSITDEAILSGYGDPVGEANKQLATAIANKIDNDVVEIINTTGEGGVNLIFDGTAKAISYAGVVDAEDLFNEETSSDKVLYVHPKQMTQLRKDSDFISADKYGTANVMTSGEVGKIGTCRVVRSKKVACIEYAKDNSAGTIEIVADSVTETTSKKHLETIQPATAETLVVGDKVKAITTPYYLNPIVKLANDAETEEDAPAVTIFLKRDTQVERERKADAGITNIFTNKHYGVALTNATKVVLAKFKK